MGQLYVPEGTWSLCSNGKKIVKVQVSSQSTIRIEDKGKLAMTEEDRFDGNFICPPMMTAGSVVGAVLVAALVASGPALVVFAAGAVGAIGGGTALMNYLPSICSILCKGSQWTSVHPKVRFEKKKALLQNATLQCMFGGVITLKLPNYQESIDMGLLAGIKVYQSRGGDEDYNKLTQDQKDRLAEYDVVDLKTLGLNPLLFGEEEGDGYHAELYRNKKSGKYVLAFRGTQSLKDVQEDVVQGVGISSEYYDNSVKLIRKMKESKDSNREAIFSEDSTIITGHSLGGGMAATAGGASGYPTYTYNAAGVHDATLARQDKPIQREDLDHVQAYNSNNDILNAVQDSREGFLRTLGLVGKLAKEMKGMPRAAGQRIQLETDNMVMQGASVGHAAINVVEALERERSQGSSQSVYSKR